MHTLFRIHYTLLKLHMPALHFVGSISERFWVPFFTQLEMLRNNSLLSESPLLNPCNQSKCINFDWFQALYSLKFCVMKSFNICTLWLFNYIFLNISFHVYYSTSLSFYRTRRYVRTPLRFSPLANGVWYIEIISKITLQNRR